MTSHENHLYKLKLTGNLTGKLKLTGKLTRTSSIATGKLTSRASNQ